MRESLRSAILNPNICTVCDGMNSGASEVDFDFSDAGSPPDFEPKEFRLAFAE